MPIEEREQIDPHVHNNPPKILHPLNLISPSLKIDHNTVQRLLKFNSLFGVLIFITPWKTVGRKIGCFFLLYKRTDAQPKKIGRPGPKKGGAAERKNGRPSKKKIAPTENKNIGAPIKK